MNKLLVQKEKPKESLPTTRIIQYLAPSKKALLFPHIDERPNKKTKIAKTDLKGQIIYVAKRISDKDDQSERNNEQIASIRQQNEEFKADLKKSSNQNKEDPHLSPLHICGDLVTLYEEKNYAVPKFKSNTNLFSTNPLIQKEEEIKHFYGSKRAEEKSLKKTRNDKTEQYLLKLETITHHFGDSKIFKTQFKDKQFSRNPSLMPKSQTKLHTQSNSLNIEQPERDIPHSKKNIQNENHQLRRDIQMVLQTLSDDNNYNDYDVRASNCKKKTEVSLKKRRNERSSIDSNANPSLTCTTLPTNHSPKNTSKPSFSSKVINRRTQAKTRSTTFEAEMNLLQNQSQLLKAEPSIRAKIANLSNDIREKPKKEIIDKLYDFIQETDFDIYRSCLYQYHMKHHKTSLSATFADKTSKGITQRLKKHFKTLNRNITKSDYKEVCRTNYNRIGKREVIDKKLLVLDKLDNDLTKFNLFFIKKHINNEKGY